jgi:hypothetical protein
VAQSPLYTILQPVLRKIRKWNINVALWVDDLLSIFIPKTPHNDCKGAIDGCVLCLDTVHVAKSGSSQVRKLITDIGFATSEKQHTASQVGQYTGIIHDTVRGVFLIPHCKLEKLHRCNTDIDTSQSFTPRILAKLRGKLIHYDRTMYYLRPLATALSVIISTEGHPDKHSHLEWDAVKARQLTDGISEICAEVREYCSYCADKGKPIWEVPPSTQYGRFMDKVPSPATPYVVTTYEASVYGTPDVVTTYDASVLGNGSRSQLTPDEPGVEIVHTAIVEQDQVHRESEGAIQAITALIPWAKSVGISLAHKNILIRGDCSPALQTLQKGSFKSEVLQRHARKFQRFCFENRITPSFLHIPGTEMIANGVDELSREGAAEIAGPSLDEQMKAEILEMCNDANITITIDLFASCTNKFTDRYCSRFYEPESESTDAFAKQHWGCSRCPTCSSPTKPVWHRDHCLAFLPPTMSLQKFVQKAQSDGFSGVIVTPAHQTSGFWRAIERTIVPGIGHELMFTKCKTRFAGRGQACKIDKFTAVLVNFTNTHPSLFPELTPACAQVLERRQQCPARYTRTPTGDRTAQDGNGTAGRSYKGLP